MATWRLQEAKVKLSKIIEDAATKGPQFITQDGAECAVILSIEEYSSLTAKPDLRAYLLGGPKVDRFDIARD